MDTLQLRLLVEISPKYMIKNIDPYIKKELNNKYKDNCYKNIGYIIDIIDYKIEDNYINDISNNLVFVTICKTLLLKPKIGKIIDCNITMIFNHGIFCEKSNLKLLIPISNLSSYHFDNKKKNFSKPGIILKKDDMIQVIITNIRYSKHNFNCIGILKE